jgi:hypothetical protein
MTINQNRSDEKDVEFMIYWLAREKMFIDFDSYQGEIERRTVGDGAAVL